MSNRQFGFGVVQIVAVVAAVAVASLIAVPKYKAYLEKAKLTEAFTLAGDARKKVNEFYALSGHFPKTAIDADSVMPETVTAPEYVEKIVIDPKNENHAVVIQAHMKPGLIRNEQGGEQYFFMAADHSSQPGAQIVWSCGGVGIDADLLPESCR